MKENIMSAFKTKYQSFGLSNEAVDRIASALEKTVTKDEEIEGALANVTTMELIAKEIQKMRDGEIQRRTDLQKSFDTYKQSHPDQKPDPKPAGAEGEDEGIKKQLELIMARLDKRDKEEREKFTLSSIKTSLEKDGCKNAEVLALTLKGFALGENETEEAAAARLKEEYNASMKRIFGNGPIPNTGSGGSEGADDDAVIKRREKWVKEHEAETNPDNK